MSSPFRRSDHSRSSPVRTRLNGLHHSRTHSHSTHEKDAYCEEMSRLHIDTEKAYQKLLDERAREQKQKHLEGLDKALEKHELVQRSARECVERIQLEQQQVRLRQEAEERRRLEEERRKLEETRRKIAEEEQKRQDAERKQQQEREAELRRKQEQEAAQKVAEQKRKEDEEARQKAEREKAAAEKEAKDKAAAEQAARTQQQSQQQSQTQQAQPQQVKAQAGPAAVNGAPTQQAPSSIMSDEADRQKLHDAYMGIHQRLKEVRQTVRKAMEDNQQLKASLTAMTSQMKKSVGQISRKDKKANKEKIQLVIQQIEQSLAINVTTDMSQFMYNPTPVQPIEGPMILVYMLNVFSKCIIQQIDTEVGSLSDEKGDGADALGIAVALIFSNPKYLIDGRSLVDIMWATYRRNIPRIFGVKVVKPLPKNIKNTGALAAGFAAITLRQFPTGRVNPAPNRMFWEALARIVNVPREKLKRDHFIILDGMLQPTFVSKFIQIYGAAALAAVRHVIMDIAPSVRDSNPSLRSEATGVHDLHHVLDRQLHLPLL